MNATEPRDETPCYIGRCRKCENLVAAAVDDPEHSGARKRETAKFVASLIRDGISVDRMAVSDVRTATWCKCYRKQQQNGELFSEVSR